MTKKKKLQIKNKKCKALKAESIKKKTTVDNIDVKVKSNHAKVLVHFLENSGKQSVKSHDKRWKQLQKQEN